jgi:maltose alpha-D-glucosyltransferase/alpha-amylase
MKSRAPVAPASLEDLPRVCAPFELQKACYELRYELDNRPAWVAIPLAGIRRILGRPLDGG